MTTNAKLSLQHVVNGLQFSLKVEALPLDNLEIGRICLGYRYQVRKLALFRIAGKLQVKPQITASIKYKLLTYQRSAI